MNSRMFAAGCGKGDIFDFERFLEKNYNITKHKVQLYPVVATSSRKRTEAGKDAGSISPPSHERRLGFWWDFNYNIQHKFQAQLHVRDCEHNGRQHDLEQRTLLCAGGKLEKRSTGTVPFPTTTRGKMRESSRLLWSHGCPQIVGWVAVLVGTYTPIAARASNFLQVSTFSEPFGNLWKGPGWSRYYLFLGSIDVQDSSGGGRYRYTS